MLCALTESVTGYDEWVTFWGWCVKTNSTAINNLTYHYPVAENQLTSIDDAGSQNITGTFTYDANGNMLTDSKKNITISYNYLDLPDTVKQGSSKLVFTYDAAGNKLYKQLITSGTVVSQKHYIEDAEVTATTSIAYDGKIESIAMGEGRIENTASGYKYEYFLQDHLYNNRVSFRVKSDGTADLSQVQNYYPFGGDMGDTTMNYTTIPNNLHKYNGKELQTELKLESYDFGARHYDPLLGRWMTMDPMAIQFDNQSPYNYVGNDPLNMIDPDGMQYYSGNLPLPYAPTSSSTGAVAGAAGGNATAGLIGGAIQLGMQFWNNPFAEKTKTVENFSTLKNLQGNVITPAARSSIPETHTPNPYSKTKSASYSNLPTNQGTIKSWPPTDEVNYQDFGLRTTSLGTMKGVVDGYSLASGYAAVKALYTSYSASKIALTVLGSYNAETGGYVALAKSLNANYFEIPINIWNEMTPVERWGANLKFLNRTIARGDQIILSNSAFTAQKGTSFYEELQYLYSKGYKPAINGMSLVKP